MTSLASAADPAARSVTAEEGLNRLKAGDERFVADKISASKPNGDRRAATAKEQHPFAIEIRLRPDENKRVYWGGAFLYNGHDCSLTTQAS
jgi:hypothetical protein